MSVDNKTLVGMSHMKRTQFHFTVAIFCIISGIVTGIQLDSPFRICESLDQAITINVTKNTVSSMHCNAFCVSVAGCLGTLWINTSRNCSILINMTSPGDYVPDIIKGAVFIRNKTICQTTSAGSSPSTVPLVFNGTVGTLVGISNKSFCEASFLASASSFHASYPPCSALAYVIKDYYQSNESLSNRPEWWYDLVSTCLISSVEFEQKLASNQNTSIYVLKSLTNLRDNTTLCYSQRVDLPVISTGTLFSCIQNLIGRYILITRSTPGMLQFKATIIRGACS